MDHHLYRLVLVVTFGLFLVEATFAAEHPALSSAQAKIDAKIAELSRWAADPVIVDAVRAHNASITPAEESLDQEAWHNLASLDPLVRQFTQNAVSAFLRSRRTAAIGEAFVSDAAGRKVGFINKPTRWCHAGQPKHDLPMQGKTWQGRIEFDESTGLRLIQVSVPVLDDGKPIGSLVVGLSTAFLNE